MDSMFDTPSLSDDKTDPSLIINKPKKSKLGFLLVLFFGFICFIFFLMMKLPEERIQNLITAHIKIEAQRQDLSFSAESIQFGIFLGPSIKFKNVEMKSLSEEGQRLKIEFLKIKPDLFSLLLPLKKGYFYAKMPEGEVEGTVGASLSETLIDLSFKKVNTAKISLLKKFLPLEINGVIDGFIDVVLNSVTTSSSHGKIDLKLIQVQAPAQSVMGFNIPSLSISQSTFQTQITAGKMTLSNVVIGKNISQDSLVASANGDIQLDKYLTNSKLALKATFDISKSVKDSFPLLENLLAPARLSDGKYSYQFTGPAYSPMVVPGK